MLHDPTLEDLYTQTSEEYYDDILGCDPEDLTHLDDECPDWIQDQLDEDLPF